MSAGTRPDPAWLSFRRIADTPFGTCVAALESWQLPGPGAGLAPVSCVFPAGAYLRLLEIRVQAIQL